MQTENYTIWMPVQIYYSLNVLTGDDDFNEISLEEQRKILPDLLAWYSLTWFAKNCPHNEEDLPDGVKSSKHLFLSTKKRDYHFVQNT